MKDTKDYGKTCYSLFKLNKKLIVENRKLKNENDLLKEELTNLKNDITRVYNTMICLETINNEELEEVEEI